MTVASRKWSEHSIVVTPSTPQSSLMFFLYADGPDDGRRTVTEYRRMRADRYDLETAERCASPNLRLAEVELAAGTHELDIHQGVDASTLLPLSPVGDCYSTDERSASEVGIAAEARSRVACNCARVTTPHVCSRRCRPASSRIDTCSSSSTGRSRA